MQILVVMPRGFVFFSPRTTIRATEARECLRSDLCLRKITKLVVHRLTET